MLNMGFLEDVEEILKEAPKERQTALFSATMPPRIAALMRSADVLLTKAGGLTLAEAFCCGVPVIVQDVVPGQEAGNLEYVLDQGAVEYARSPEGLVECVAKLRNNPQRASELAAGGTRLARPRAARDIATNVLGRL